MNIAKKIILMISGVLLLVFIFLTGTVWYLYAHPDRVKGLVEGVLSDATGASVVLGRLDYALDPFHVAAEGISLRPGERFLGIHLEAPNFRADLSSEGPFARKTLVIEYLELSDFSCRILKDAKMPSLTEREKSPSFFSGLLKRLVALFVFRDIRIQQVAVLGGNLTLQTSESTLEATQIEARLNKDHRIEISLGLSLAWPSKMVRLSIPSLQVKTDKVLSLTNPEIRGRVIIAKAALESPFTDLKDSRLATTLIYKHDQGKVDFKGLNLTLPAASIKSNDGKNAVPIEIVLDGDGMFNIEHFLLAMHPLKVVMTDGLEFSGGLDAALGPENRISVDVDTCRLVPLELMRLAPSRIRERMGLVELRGSIGLTGSVQVQEEGDGWAWDTNLTARLEKNPFDLNTDQMQLTGQLTGTIQGRGRVPDVAMSATVSGEQIVASVAGVELKPSTADLTIVGTYPVFEVKDISAQIQSMRAMLGKEAYHLNDIHMEMGRGRINVATQRVSFPKIQLDSSQLKALTFSLHSEKGQRKIEFSGQDTGFAQWAGTLGLLPTGWTLSGKASINVRIRLDGQENALFSAEFDFPKLGFQNGDGTILGDQLNVEGTIHGKTDLKAGLISADAALDAKGGEALLDRFYVNLKTFPLSVRVKGTTAVNDRHLDLDFLSFGLKELFSCNLAGKLFQKDTGWQVDLSAHIPDTPLKPLFAFFIREPFQVESPFVKKMHASGEISAAVDLKGGRSNWSVKGDLKWEKGKFRIEEPEISLDEIDLSLPLLLRRHRPKRPWKTVNGHLSIGSMRIPPLPAQALDLTMKGRPNSLTIDGPIGVKVPGGDVRMDPVQIRDLAGPSPRLTTGFSTRKVNITPLLKDIWPQPMNCALSGALQPVELQGSRLTSQGDMTVSVSGGTVTVSNPGVRGLFTGAPVIFLDARWEDLNLQKLTAGTAFGEIEGLLRGYARDLEIAQGQPQKFDLFLETVETDSIPQRISVKAVDNIAQMAGGQSPFVGMAGAFASLFKEFPYEKIGIHATLENDIFTVNGTIHEGGKEYLVKRGLFSGVNVVNQNPDNRVGFKDMIKRFKRITSSKGGPVIK